MVLCKRVPSDNEHENVAGVTFYVHRLDGEVVRHREEALSPACEIAPVATRDAAYRAILGALDLSSQHRENLRCRGLSDAAIDIASYRSLPLEGRSRLARVAADAAGSDVAGVPGYRVQRDGTREWASIAGAPGLLVPCRDSAGHIVSLKVRRDDPRDGPRYLYVSSAKHGGASAECAAHVPIAAEPRRIVCVTEGELKADVITHLSGLPALSMPGIGAWRSVVPILGAWRCVRVHLALDADVETNEHVAASAMACLRGLRRMRLRVVPLRWSPKLGKGWDDVLVARRIIA